MSTSNSITTSAVAGTSMSQVLHLISSIGAPRKSARDLPVVGLVVHLHLAGVGEDRIDADDQRGLGRDAHLLALGQVLAEAVERLRREREGVLAENEEAIVADVRHAGLRDPSTPRCRA